MRSNRKPSSRYSRIKAAGSMSANATCGDPMRPRVADAATLTAMARLSEPSPYVEFDRTQWRALRMSTPLKLTEEEVVGLRGLGEQTRPARGRRGLPAAGPADPPSGRRAAAAVRRDRGVPRRTAAESGPAGAVRHRRRGQRRGRQVDHRPCAAGAAGPLGAPPAGRSGHHRRISLPQRRAGAAKHHAPQGFSGELRPPRAAAIRHRR